MADEKGEVAQVPQEKFIEMIHAQNEQCAMAVEQRPRNDQALAVWGAGLLQLAMMEDEVPKKKELLRDCREKLNKAIKVNPDAASPDGQLAIFQLVNAFCNAPAPSQISSKPLQSPRTIITKSSKINTKMQEVLRCVPKSKKFPPGSKK